MALDSPEIDHDRTHPNRMASELSFATFARKDFGRLLLRTLLKFCAAMAFEDEFLGIALLAGLTAGAFPAWRGARLSPV